MLASLISGTSCHGSNLDWMKYDDILSVEHLLSSRSCQVGAKRYMGANSWNLCSDTEGPMAPLNMLWLGGVVLEPRGDATSAGWVAQVVKGKAQVCITELLSWEPVSPSSVPF